MSTAAAAGYAKNRPNWALMDIRMKGVDGLTATREIATAWPEARVVTAYNDASLREAARLAGACAYILKENLGDLVQVLQRSADLRP